MFTKTLITLTLALTMTACANQTTTPTPQTQATETKRDYAKEIVGKWRCSLNTPEMKFSSEDDIRANGVWQSKSLLQIPLSETVAYRYQYESTDHWRVEGDQIIAKNVAVSNIKELVSENKTERSILNAFETSNPETKKMKQEFLTSLAEVDDSEIRAKITRLTPAELEFESGSKNKTVCTRVM